MKCIKCEEDKGQFDFSNPCCRERHFAMELRIRRASEHIKMLDSIKKRYGEDEMNRLKTLIDLIPTKVVFKKVVEPLVIQKAAKPVVNSTVHF